MTGQLSLSNILHVYLETWILKEYIAHRSLKIFTVKLFWVWETERGKPTSIDIWVLADMKCWLGGAKERRQINDCQGKRAPGWAYQGCAYSRHGNRRTPKAQMANRWCTFEWDIKREIDMILTFIVIWGWFNRTLVCSAEGQEQNNRPCSISLHL